MDVEKLGKALADLFLPRRCAVCGCTLIDAEKHLCTACMMDFPRTYFWLQERNSMADRFNAAIERRLTENLPVEPDNDSDASPVFVPDTDDGAEASAPANPIGWSRPMEPYACAIALYFYQEGYRELSKSLKYRAAISLGRYISEALGRKISECPWLGDIDLIIPVPLHPLRRLRRGYNQAEIIARSIASVLNERPIKAGPAEADTRDLAVKDAQNLSAEDARDLSAKDARDLSAEDARSLTAKGSRDLAVEVECGILRRSRRTSSQTAIDPAHKAGNVAGAFSVRADRLPQCRHVLLVDDVFTSGSTLTECQRTLREAMIDKFGETAGTAIRISAATLAFVGE